jgi:chorismate mutase
MNGKRLYGIRGAVCCDNRGDSILQGVDTLCSALFSQNNLTAQDLVSIQFTVTSDITAMNPAAALRQSSLGAAAAECPLFCALEPPVTGGLPRTIRTLITAYLPEGSRPVHIYRDGAEVLRPDLGQLKK